MKDQSPLGKKRLSKEEYIEGIFQGNRMVLGKAITLAESKLPSDKTLASEVLAKILPETGKSIRIGITGVPGAGKSTFIEALGKHLTSLKKKVAVLAVDPTSKISKGSILGDKTRMEELSADPLAIIRPSPAGETLGGISQNTRKIILLCEAAGYNVILIETVGVGQSEIQVHSMVDFFLLMMLTGAGDDLQNIKKGILEMADAVLINKTDGSNIQPAESMKKELEQTLHSFSSSKSGWQIPVLTCSSLNKTGISSVWKTIEAYQEIARKKEWFEQNRKEQYVHWMHDSIREELIDTFFSDPALSGQRKEKEKKVKEGKENPMKAAADLIKKFRSGG